MENSIIKTSKPGKLILLGEYAVLEQAPCLVAAADRHCMVEIEEAERDTFKIEASNPDIADVEFTVDADNGLKFKKPVSPLDQERLRFVTAVLNNVIDECNGQIEPAVIKIDTTGFYHASGDKLGLGASAAITVTLFAGLREYIGKPLSGEELYRAAFPIHRKAQGKLGSGTDIAASAVGGVMQYQMPEDAQTGAGVIESLNWPRNLQVIPVWAGKSASTQDLVQQIRTYRKANPSSYKAIMEPMIELSEQGCTTFKTGDLDGLQDIITDYIRLERKLGEASNTDIVSEAHQKIAQVVMDAGSVYKPSGAGSGDMGVAFCDGLENRMKVEAALENSSFDIIDLSLQTPNIYTEASNIAEPT